MVRPPSRAGGPIPQGEQGRPSDHGQLQTGVQILRKGHGDEAGPALFVFHR